MAGEIRKLRRSEGVTVGAPTDLSIENEASSFADYATDAAYVTAKGSAAVEGDVYFNTTTDRVRVYATGAWADLGTGSGSGSLNYIIPTSFVGYDDAAATPVDGAGGVFDTTLTTENTTAPLIGQSDIKWSKGAANFQGEGLSVNFTIDKAFTDKPQVFKIKFYYAGSANFDPAFVTVWIYDRDGLNMIQPAPYTLDGSGLFEGYWQPQAGNNDYRLIIHNASTSALAWDLQIDDVTCGPSEKVHGPAMSDWTAFTPALSAFAVGTSQGFFRRVGDSMEVVFSASHSGAGAGGSVVLTLPASAVIASSSRWNSTGHVVATSGSGMANLAGSMKGLSVYSTADGTGVIFYKEGEASDSIDGAEFINADQLGAHFTVPIAGWSSNTLVSSDADSRVVSFSAKADSSQSVSDGVAALISFANELVDTHGGWNGTNQYTIPVSGIYQISAKLIEVSVNVTASELYYTRLQIDGAPADHYLNYDDHQATLTGRRLSWGGTYTRSFNAGQTVQLLGYLETNAVSWTVDGNSLFTITRISGPAQIAASEVVSFSAVADGTQSGIADGVATVIEFKGTGFKHDTHTAWDGINKYTVPVSGIYQIDTKLIEVSVDLTAGELYYARLQIDGSPFNRYFNFDSHYATLASSKISWGGSLTLQLNAGQTIQILGYLETNASTWTVDGSSTIAIKRIGGVM